ncbi:hypothetical protein F442_11349 [Phytophthora nicotianae P10297]|uniref:Uncharacterized protein n=2 Tax=Phytophthora nicotianae TaxID=4792 RepID=V9EYU1_PHYNI|nr:hypothetical protein F443_11459 [Phytophthora nicotianae P1569]ETP41566.1 hypothetical protein F442_11349 [Phytophthora nicotianae P10297]
MGIAFLKEKTRRHGKIRVVINKHERVQSHLATEYSVFGPFRASSPVETLITEYKSEPFAEDKSLKKKKKPKAPRKKLKAQADLDSDSRDEIAAT